MALLSLAFFALSVNVLAQSDTILVYNPGPIRRCYDYNYFSQCQPNVASAKYYSECSGVTPNAPSFMAGGYNSNTGTNGYFSGGANHPLNISLVNRASSTQSGCGASCADLKEVTFEYTYPGFAIKKDPNGNQYNLALYDQWIVEYDAYVHLSPDCPECMQWYSQCVQNQQQTYPGTCQVSGQGTDPACKNYMRQYLTTDFIYYWSTPDGKQYKNLISIIHYNPIHTAASVGPFRAGDGYRIAVNGPPGLVPGQTTRVSLDFKALIQQYSAQLCHGGNGQIPQGLALYSLQVVSSNVNTSSTIDITNANIILRNNPDRNIRYPTPTASFATPTYCPAQAATPGTGSAACSVQYNFESSWSTGYTVDVKIGNQGSAPIQNWNLAWTMPGSDTISNYWSSSISQSGNRVMAQNDQSNYLIAPGSTVDFGFNVNRSPSTASPQKPASFALNGQPCRVV